MKKLTILGSVNVDHILTVPYFAKPGETLTGYNYNIEFGGKGANQAVAVARLKSKNIEVQFLGCIGDDSIGSQIKESMKNDGIDVSHLQQNIGVMTGVAFIQVSESGKNSIVLASGANDCVDLEYVKQCQQKIESSNAILMQLETPIEAVALAAKFAKNKQKLVVLNPAPAKPLTDELLSLVDIITPNETEAEILTGIEVTDEISAKKAAEVFHQKGIRTVLITLGKKGVFVSVIGEISEIISGFSVKAIDTTAAGDTFNGAFLCEYLDGKPLKEALRFAQGAAALSVTRKGAQPSVPNREEVIEFIK